MAEPVRMSATDLGARPASAQPRGHEANAPSATYEGNANGLKPIAQVRTTSMTSAVTTGASAMMATNATATPGSMLGSSPASAFAVRRSSAQIATGSTAVSQAPRQRQHSLSALKPMRRAVDVDETMEDALPTRIGLFESMLRDDVGIPRTSVARRGFRRPSAICRWCRTTAVESHDEKRRRRETSFLLAKRKTS